MRSYGRFPDASENDPVLTQHADVESTVRLHMSFQ